MRKALFSILFIGGIFGGLSIPEQAAEKMEAEKYGEAVALYDSSLTISDYDTEHRAIHFNRGQAFFELDSIDRAQEAYSKCTNLNPREMGLKFDRQVGSWAWNNIGISRVKRGEAQQQAGSSPMSINPGGGNMPNMAPAPGQSDTKQVFEEALKAFKEALKLDPENESARFNYELLKKRMLEMEQQNQDQQNQDQDQQQQQDQQDDKKQDDQQDQQKQEDKEGDSDQQKQPKPQNNEEKNAQNSNQQQNQGEPQEMEMSQEQAAQLLEAMNEKEKQFIQQLEKSSPKKGRRKRNDGPDW